MWKNHVPRKWEQKLQNLSRPRIGSCTHVTSAIKRIKSQPRFKEWGRRSCHWTTDPAKSHCWGGGGAACRQWQGKLETFFFNLSHLRHCSCSYKQEVLLPGSEGKHCASVQGFSPQQLCENAAWFLFLQCISSSPASAPFVHSAAYTVRPQTLYFWDLEDKFSELKCCPGLFPRNLPENGLLRFDSQWLEP